MVRYSSSIGAVCSRDLSSTVFIYRRHCSQNTTRNPSLPIHRKVSKGFLVAVMAERTLEPGVAPFFSAKFTVQKPLNHSSKNEPYRVLNHKAGRNPASSRFYSTWEKQDFGGGQEKVSRPSFPGNQFPRVPSRSLPLFSGEPFHFFPILLSGDLDPISDLFEGLKELCTSFPAFAVHRINVP